MAKPLRIGIAGLGTVGIGVVKILHENAEILAQRSGRALEVVVVASRDTKKDRGIDLSGMKWVEAKDMPLTNIDVVVETIGGSEGIAHELVKASLAAQKHVVSANKALLAHHGFDLAMLAEDNGVSLNYEAAVAGGVPVIKALREGLAANRIKAVYGILNGTCNYILTNMRESGRDFDVVLKEAQAMGYAETDPAFDVDGVDAGHKLALLSAIAFGVRPDFKSVRLRGIRDITAIDIIYANELGYKIKLLGIAKEIEGALIQSVEPCLVPASSPLGAIEDVYNAVFIEGNFVGTPLFTGRGAGQDPTASAVVADLVDIARGLRVPTFGVPAKHLKQSKALDPADLMARYYLRFTVYDRPGVLADVSAILRDHNVSIEGLIQRGRDPDQPVPLIMTTHETRFADIFESARLIEKLNCAVDKPCLMRIEDNL